MTGLPNVAALLEKATPGPWEYDGEQYVISTEICDVVADLFGANGLDSDGPLVAAAPDLAACLIEAADALRNARDPASSWNIDDKVRTARIQHYVDPVLARLLAFDASLKETTE